MKSPQVYGVYVQLEVEMVMMKKGTELVSRSLPHASSWNLNELVRQLLVSQLSMVRSVKVTLPSASIRITVLVLMNKTKCIITNLKQFWTQTERQDSSRGQPGWIMNRQCIKRLWPFDYKTLSVSANPPCRWSPFHFFCMKDWFPQRIMCTNSSLFMIIAQRATSGWKQPWGKQASEWKVEKKILTLCHNQGSGHTLLTEPGAWAWSNRHLGSPEQDQECSCETKPWQKPSTSFRICLCNCCKCCCCR